MAKLGRKSITILATCDERIRTLVEVVIRELREDDPVCHDLTVISGYRTDEEQAQKVREGNSLTLHSKHRETPSEAVDIAPYPVDWADEDAFVYLAGRVMATADRLGIKILWGGSWVKLRDLGHFELLQED